MTDSANELSAMLTKKLNVYDEFLSSTRQLLKALETGQFEMVNTFVQRREELIRIIDDVDRQINRCQKQGRAAQIPLIADSIEDLSDHIRHKLGEIGSVNGDCQAVAENSRDDIRRELMTLRQTKEGLHGYAPKKMGKTPKFLQVAT